MAQRQGPRHQAGSMIQCHILPPHRELLFRGAEGCTKDISHDGPHTAVLKDGTTIEWETDWECDCCVDDEIPDMCIVWREVDLKGKDHG